MTTPILPAGPSTPPPASDREARLRAASVELEASFLAEMLKAAKFGEPRGAFGGGTGEEQYASFFRVEIARKMAGAGGIGLAEQLFQTLIAREKDAPGG